LEDLGRKPGVVSVVDLQNSILI